MYPYMGPQNNGFNGFVWAGTGGDRWGQAGTGGAVFNIRGCGITLQLYYLSIYLSIFLLSINIPITSFNLQILGSFAATVWFFKKWLNWGLDNDQNHTSRMTSSVRSKLEWVHHVWSEYADLSFTGLVSLVRIFSPGLTGCIFTNYSNSYSFYDGNQWFSAKILIDPAFA